MGFPLPLSEIEQTRARAGQDIPGLANDQAEAREIRSTEIYEWARILQPRQRKPRLVVAADEWRARQPLGSATTARLSFPLLLLPLTPSLMQLSALLASLNWKPNPEAGSAPCVCCSTLS